MKRTVFISHSSKDRWIAERIKEGLERIQLEDRGVAAFLSEDDIEDGEKFAEVIDRALLRSHEVAVLVSSASRESPWVLYEAGACLGGRDRKKLVAILISGTPPPDPLKSRQRIELNDIERYYRGVERRLQEMVWEPPPVHRFEVGDRVRIVGPASPADAKEAPVWNSAMDRHKGKVTKVREVMEGDTAELACDRGTFPWAFRWLEPL